MPILCKECGGTGVVEFTRERGGPQCNGCHGKGYIGAELVTRTIARILDGNSVYMGGPSQQSMKRAAKIVESLTAIGFDIPE